MLCFLPPVLPTPPEGQPPATPPRCGSVAAAVMVVLAAGTALLTPIGWVRSQPIYSLHVGIPTRLGPRAEDRDLATRLGHGDRPGRRAAFFARQERYDALPPGLSVEAATGALVGVPTMAGTYTLAVGVTDGTRQPMIGSSFKVKVLPAS